MDKKNSGSPEYIEHHGVKGQRWGVRKKEEIGAVIDKIHKRPPANLKERQAQREAKAQKFVKKSDDLQRRIDAGNNKINEINRNNPNIFQKMQVNQLRQDQRYLEDQKAHADKSAQAKREGKLTPTQKKLLIGGAVVGGLIIGGVVASQVNSGQFRQNVNRGREVITRKKFKFTEAPELKGNWSADQIHKLVVPDINPGYPGPGSSLNCRRCTFAYEMRRRGNDVAATQTINASGQNAIGLFNVLDTEAKDISQRRGMKILTQLTNPKNVAEKTMLDLAKNGGTVNKFKSATPEEIFSVLSKQPERSRGELGVFWKGGGGHSVAYEIIDGKAHIFDCQTGKLFKEWTDMHIDWPDMDSAGFTRLDNVNLDTNFVQRWVKNVKS